MKIHQNFLILSNYNSDISWVPGYTSDYLIYDRSDKDFTIGTTDQQKIIKSPNVGYNLYDYFTFIIDHYDSLPERIMFAKGNVFPRHISREYFTRVANNTTFTPLEEYIPTPWPINKRGTDGGFCELNNSWYTKHFQTQYFHTYNDFLKFCFANPTIPTYIRFAPGANYIVPRENILRYPKVFYENLRFFVSYTQLSGEAHMIERALYTIWYDAPSPHERMFKKLTEKDIVLSKKPAQNILQRAYIWSATVTGFVLSKMGFLNKKSVNPIALAEYRKKIKIYDIFTYNGEVDILDIRLHVLADVVDQFIIVEAPTTFSGKPKPLYFQEQKERFAAFAHKIKYFVIDDYPNDPSILTLADSSSNVPKNGPEHWRREFYQKESIKKALVGLHDNDICFIGDVDEIWNPDVLIDYSSDAVFKLRQTVYSYYVNNKSDELWAGTLVTKYKNIKDACLNHLRTKGKTKYTYINNGGWHFTSIGGIDEVRRKLNDSYTDESYNTASIQQHLVARFGKEDYMGRNFTFSIDESALPSYLLEHKEKYKHLFK